MLRRRPSPPRPLWVLALKGAVAAWLAALAFLSVDFMKEAYLGERSAMIEAVGRSEEAIFAASMPSEILEAGDERPLSRWYAERGAVARIWGNLLRYRISVLGAWFWTLFPALAALVIDAYCVREVRKYRFVSQSPLRHKMAARAAYILAGAGAGALLAPVSLPANLVPLTLCGIATGFWLWVVNLQKRL